MIADSGPAAIILESQGNKHANTGPWYRDCRVAGQIRGSLVCRESHAGVGIVH